ncbi:hypothetical protein V493_07732 [Pseudogymnoascus sp. VKM F-4281 (FW-2241)]|nr:hypothetical protein V493_07732 [Pseudogymnoascus sp. VKM F-4281 (FW-2241)]
MPSLLLYAVTALITYIAYCQLFALFQIVAGKAPPVAANTWWAFLSGKNVPGGALIERFYEKVRLFFVFVFEKGREGLVVEDVRDDGGDGVRDNCETGAGRYGKG